MKVLLFDTGDVRDELNEPIGIELLAAQTVSKIKSGVEIELKWFNFDGLSFQPNDYGIIGVSVHINGLEVFENIYQKCQDCNYSGLIVAGNSIATFAYEQLLNLYPTIICSIGEGEDTFPLIVQKRLKGEIPWSAIPNLAYMEDGKLILTERRVFDIRNYIPPKRDFLELIRQHGGICRVEASRGCAWNRCAFCGAEHKYNHVGWRPVQLNVIREQLIQLSEARIYNVYFCDEDFIGNHVSRFSEVVKMIREEMACGAISSEMSFFISIKPPDLLNERCVEIIRGFIKCGLKEIFIGIESGSGEQLKRYRKCSTPQVNRIAIERSKELQTLGLSVDIGFIFFDYDMSVEDVMDNIRFIEENKLYLFPSSLIKSMRIQPYTKLFDKITSVHKNPFSIDDLFYSYHFADNTVEIIHSEYEKLNLEGIARKLQSAYRRSLSSKVEREQSQEKLKKLRALEFLAIKVIVASYTGNNDMRQMRNALEDIMKQAKELLSV